MTWIIVVSVVLLVVALAGLFVHTALMIRRDLTSRFERFRLRLEDEASAILRELLDRPGQS